MPSDHDERSPSMKKTLRKRHQKSRKGCTNCKIRRIKCDENKPQCSYCIRREFRCSFLPLSPRPASPFHSLAPFSAAPAYLATPVTGVNTPASGSGHDWSEPPLQRPRPLLADPLSEGLDAEDFLLLHHYTISTSYTLASIPALQTFMRVNIPQIAFSNRFLLHGVLGVAALHLSHFKRDASEANLYLTKALHHYGIGLRAATSLMANVDAQTGPALYVFPTVCFSFTLGLGPKPGDFLAFGKQGVSEWLTQFRGMKSLLQTNPELFHDDILSPVFQISIRHLAQPKTNNDHLPELRELILETAADDPNLPIYITALDQLSQCFPSGSLSTSRTSQLSPQQVFMWIYLLEEDFVRLLQDESPIPLVILSHFCILLNGLGSFWWIRGWAEHLLSEIYSSVNQEYRAWMRRPMEETGWIPG